MHRRDPRLEILTKTIERLIPGATPAYVTVTVTETLPGRANPDGTPHKHEWSGRPEDLAVKQFTALWGRPRTGEEGSPLAQAEDAKRRRDLPGELGVLMQAGNALESAPWYPCRPGDLVHVHYEANSRQGAYGETYLIRDAGDGLMSMQLLAPRFASGDPNEDACVVEAADCPIYELWFEAGPHRLTIVRDGQVVHDGPRASRQGPPQQQNKLMLAFALTCADAQRYLERGDTAAALARLRRGVPLPPCGTPGPMPEHQPCARWKGHHGACSPDADYTEPAHECPALPEQLHAVVTVGAKVTGVHFAGLYTDIDAAVDHASGFTGYRDCLDEPFVEDAPGAPGEKVLKLPQENQLAAYGVQLAVTVPLQVLPDPRAAEEWAAEGMATTMTADDYADDFRDVDE